MSQRDQIAATKTAFKILDVIHESQGASAAELIDKTGLSRGGVYKHLRTLIEVDALVNQNGVYILGPKFTEYELGVPKSHSVLNHTNKIDELAQSIDAPTNLWIKGDNLSICVHTTSVDDQGNYPRSRGDKEELTESPPGKVMLAYLSLEQQTHLVGTSDHELSTQLETVRERQLLEEPLSFAPEWVSLATPVLDPSDQPIGAIEIVIPSKRSNGIDVIHNISGLLTETANRIRIEML